jgi:hypothetical protein
MHQRATEQPELRQMTITLDQLRGLVAQSTVFAVFDTADSPPVYEKMQQLGTEAALSLFRNTEKEDWSQVAPYLAQVNAPMLDWIAETLWKEPWGVFLFGRMSLQDLWTHLRHFMVASLPDASIQYFRFYDPRILGAYLPVCDNRELAAFFGGMRAFGATGQDPNTVALFVREPDASQPPQPIANPWPIRPAQMEAFGKLATGDFVTRMVEHVCEVFPEETAAASKADIRASISQWITDARHWEIVEEPDVEQWIEYCVLHEEMRRALQVPWIVEIVSYPGRSAEHKLERLKLRLTFGEGESDE